jgi:hypothetical protein
MMQVVNVAPRVGTLQFVLRLSGDPPVEIHPWRFTPSRLAMSNEAMAMPAKILPGWRNCACLGPG